MAINIEDFLPGIEEHGLNTDENVDFDGTLNVQGATTLQGSLSISSADDLTVNGVIVPQEIEVTYGPIANGSIADGAFFIATQDYQVTEIDYIHATKEAAGTVNVMVERLQGTEAPGGNGDSLLTNNSNAGFDGTAANNTVQNGTLTGTSANLQLSAGDRLGVDFTGDAPGELDGVVITVALKRI